MYLRFIPFKSKEFISLNSLGELKVKKAKKEIKIGLLQTKECVFIDRRGWSEKEFKINDNLHSIGDKPAYVRESDVKAIWYKNGKIHRDEKNRGITMPAVIDQVYLCCKWYKNGKLHRIDKYNGLTLPAIIYETGTQEWYRNGYRCRNDKDEFGYSLPNYIGNSQAKEWLNQNSQPSRVEKDINGFTLPAIICNNAKEWWKNGKKHRDDKIDGITLPAVMYDNGNKEWWMNGLLHRERDINLKLLPAIEYSNRREYWVNGNQINKCIIL